MSCPSLKTVRPGVILASAIATLILPYMPASADILDLQAVNNALIRRSGGTSNEVEAESLQTKRLNDTNTRVSYLRFDISGFTQDPSTINSATLRLELVTGAAVSDGMRVYGILDGVANEATWDESMTWNTQPAGLIANSAAGLPIPATTTSALHSAPFTNSVLGVLEFTLTLADFQSFVTADGNDQLTLLFHNTANAQLGWASRTNTTGRLVPTLRLDYTPTAPPPSGHVWNGGGADDNWSTGLNWADTLPAGADQTLEFAGTTRLTPNNDLLAGTSFAGLVFNSTAGAFTVGGNDIVLGGDISSSSVEAQAVTLNMALSDNRQVAVSTGGQVTLSGVVSGGFSLTKAGAGALILSGANTYSGGTIISAGTVRMDNASALGSTLNVTINGGALDVNGNSLAFSSLNGAGGSITNSSGTAVTITLGTGDVGGTFGGSIHDGGAVTTVTKIGTGVQSLGGGSTFTGGLTINGGTIRLTGAGGAGSGATLVNPDGTLVVAGSQTNPITLAGGTLGSTIASTTTSITTGDVTAATGTTSTIRIADPGTLTTNGEVILTGTLLGSGNLEVRAGSNNPNPDTPGPGFRLRGTGVSNYSGTITLFNNVKGELQTSVPSVLFSPAGTGTIVMTAGGALLDGTTAAGSTTGGYSELNIRNNAAADVNLGNSIEITNTGIVFLNLAGAPPVNSVSTMGNLKIGDGQELGLYKATGNVQTVAFNTVTLNGGNAMFSPKKAGFGLAGSIGANLSLGPITELVANSGFTVTSSATTPRSVTLTAANSYSGTTTVGANGILQIKNAGGSATGSGGVVVAATGTLAGNGFIAPGATNGVTVAAGGFIAPGDNIATLTLDGSNTSGTVLSLSSGATFTFELGAGLSSDRISLIGGSANDINFNLDAGSGSLINFADLTGGFLEPGVYTLFSSDAPGAFSGIVVDGNNVVTSGLSIGFLDGLYAGSSLQISGNDLVLVVVPEPSIALSLLPGAGLLLMRRRRKAN